MFWVLRGCGGSGWLGWRLFLWDAIVGGYFCECYLV